MTPERDHWEAQAALEEAAARLLRDQLGWTPGQCRRMFHDQPPPSIGDWFCAVWSKNGRPADGQRTVLSEYHSVFVSITRRMPPAPDLCLEARDQLDRDMVRVISVLAPDCRDYRVVRAAQELAQLRMTGQPSGPLGWVEGLVYAGVDDLVEKGAEWFYAKPDGEDYGIVQTARFVKAKRLRSLGT